VIAMSGNHDTEAERAFSVLTEVEFVDRGDAELFRLEIGRLAKRYGSDVRSVHLERRLD
jgi:hypothetical protein